MNLRSVNLPRLRRVGRRAEFLALVLSGRALVLSGRALDRLVTSLSVRAFLLATEDSADTAARVARDWAQ